MINNNFFSTQQFNRYKQQQYSKIYQHELAHKTTAGSLAAGSIVIEKDKDGIPVAGHVEVKMPSVDYNNPDKTIKEATTVINSALAPDEPSTQDLKVAGEARGILADAKQVKNQNGECGQRLNFIA